MYKRAFLQASLWVFTLPVFGAFIPPPLTPVTPALDAQGRFVINEGVLYQLPFPMAFESGDVLLTELATVPTNSDLVRFFNNLQDFGNGAGIGNLIFMFSDTDVPPDPGDVFPIPTDRMFNVVTLSELGPENGFQGTPYQASLLDGSSISYLLVSDAPVPELSSVLLVGTALLVIGGVFHKRIFTKG